MKKIGKRIDILITILATVFVIFLGIQYLKPEWKIRSDGFGYYNYARSVMFDSDLYFKNEQEFFKNEFDIQKQTFYDQVTPTGYYPNPFAIGQAVLWTPFLFIAFWAQKIFQFTDQFAIQGYNAPFQVAVNVGSVIYGIFGMYFSYKAARLLFSKNAALFSVFTITLASPLIYYFIYEGVWSHLNSFFIVSLLYYVFLKNQHKLDKKTWVIFGFILGAVSLVRWQNVLFGSMFVVHFFYNILSKNKTKIQSYLWGMAGFFLLFISQMWVWNLLYGSYITKPASNTHMNLLNPQIVDFLFSPARGVFIWTPVYIISVIGILLLWSKGDRLLKNKIIKKGRLVLYLLIPLFLQFYINSSLSDWYGGGAPGAFGARRILNASVVFVIGFAATFDFIKKKKWGLPLLYLSSGIFISVNITLMILKAKGLIPFDLSDNLWKQFIEAVKIFYF